MTPSRQARRRRLDGHGDRISLHQPSHFLPRVESLRGLAALAVAVFHALVLVAGGGLIAMLALRPWQLDDPAIAAYRLLAVVFNGTAAVSLFFVVSGFVLQLSLARDRRAPRVAAGAFALRRLGRIVPALVVNLVAIMLAWTVLGAFSASWSARAPSVDAFVANLWLTDFVLNGATWTLQVELLAVPMILAVHALSVRAGAWVLPAGVALGSIVIFTPTLTGRFVFFDFAFMFLLGMALADRLDALSGWVARHAGALAACGAPLLFCGRFVLGYGSRWSLLVEATGAGLLCLACAAPKPTGVLALLDHSVARFLGRISYGLYLYHPPMLVFVGTPIVAAGRLVAGAEAGGPALGTVALAAAVASSILFGWLSYRLVERPAMAATRAIEARLLGAPLPAGGLSRP